MTRPRSFAHMQLDFLRQHALATSISFGPVSRSDAITVLNCPAFAARNGPLLQQVGALLGWRA